MRRHASCLLLVACLEPDGWLCACETAPWDRTGTALAARAVTACPCVHLEALELK